MFLVAVTNLSIAHKLGSVKVRELRLDSFTITIITDDFLSKSYSNSYGFTVIESPLIDKDDSRDIIFSKVTYRKEDNVFEVYKSVISGRPIYCHTNPEGEFFCSTHISMLRKAGVTIKENTEALPEFLVYGYVMPPVTLYRNIYQMIAGSRLHIESLDRKWMIKSVDQYIPPKEDKQLSSLENVEARALNYLYQAIEALNTRRDRLAILLSGGLDSSILFRICQHCYGINTTYSTEYPFEDPGKNRERKYALSAAKAFGTSHSHYEGTTKDYLRGFLHCISVAEEPLHHLQSVMFYLLFKAGIPQSSVIVLSGQGADGLWGLPLCNRIHKYMKGPHRLLSTYPMLRLLKVGLHASGRYENIIRLLTSIAEIRTQGNKYSIEKPDSIIWSLGNYGDGDWVCKYFNVTRYDIIKNRLNIIKPFLGRSIYDIVSLLDFLGDVSVTQSIWAKLGESQNRILYYPYNQLECLDYAYSVPWDMKLKKPKNILRGVARQLQIPEFIITRPKSGFGINSRSWAEKGGAFEPLIPLASRVFDVEQIRGMQSADPKRAMTFWNILNYSIWKQLCIDNEPLEVLLEHLA